MLLLLVEQTGVVRGARHERNDEDHGQRRVQASRVEAVPGDGAGQQVHPPTVEELDALRGQATHVPGQPHRQEEHEEAHDQDRPLWEVPGDDPHADEVVHDRQPQREDGPRVLGPEEDPRQHPGDRDVSRDRRGPHAVHVVRAQQMVDELRTDDASETPREGQDGLGPVQRSAGNQHGLHELSAGDGEEERHEDLVDGEVDVEAHDADVDHGVVDLGEDVDPQLRQDTAPDQEDGVLGGERQVALPTRTADLTHAKCEPDYDDGHHECPESSFSDQHSSTLA